VSRSGSPALIDAPTPSDVQTALSPILHGVTEMPRKRARRKLTKVPPHAGVRVVTSSEALIGCLREALSSGVPRLKLALLFGSTARGTDRPDSDVDVAILPEDLSIPLSAELALEARLAKACGRHVDLVRIDRASPMLAWRIARDAIVLLSEPPAEAPRFRARAAIEHDEHADVRREAARRYRLALARRAGAGSE
jgi:predicted nucleotidyltransferase